MRHRKSRTLQLLLERLLGLWSGEDIPYVGARPVLRRSDPHDGGLRAFTALELGRGDALPVSVALAWVLA